MNSRKVLISILGLILVFGIVGSVYGYTKNKQYVNKEKTMMAKDNTNKEKKDSENDDSDVEESEDNKVDEDTEVNSSDDSSEVYSEKYSTDLSSVPLEDQFPKGVAPLTENEAIKIANDNVQWSFTGTTEWPHYITGKRINDYSYLLSTVPFDSNEYSSPKKVYGKAIVYVDGTVDLKVKSIEVRPDGTQKTIDGSDYKRN